MNNSNFQIMYHLSKIDPYNYKKSFLQDKLQVLHAEFSNYKEFMIGEIGIKSLPNYSDDRLIELLMPKSLHSYNKKILKKDYYIGNLVLAQWLLNSIFTKDLNEQINTLTDENDKIIIENYCELLKNITFDLRLLDQDFQEYVKNNKIPLSVINSQRQTVVWKKPWAQDTSLFSESLISIFGQNSFNSPSNMDYHTSIIKIRVAFELRLRNLLGIMFIYNKKTKVMSPVAISKILEFLKDHENDLKIKIPISNLQKINSWANIFMHTGKLGYIWTPLFVYNYLASMFISTDDFLEIKKATLCELHNLLRGDNIDNEVHGFEPVAKVVQ